MQRTIRQPLFYTALFLFVVGLAILFWPHDEKGIIENQIERVEVNLRKQLKALESQSLSIQEAAKKDSINFQLATKNNKYPFVVFNKSKLVYWNNNIIVPDYKYLTSDYLLKFLRIPEGLFMARKWKVNDYEIIGLLPLYRSTKITNRYISPNYNKEIFSFDPERLLEPTLSAGYNICLEDQCYFQLEVNQNAVAQITSLYNKWGSIFLFISFFILLALVLSKADHFFNKYSVFWALAIITSIVILPRILMLWLSFPRDMVNISLFDSTAFASSWLNPTLGDLFINLLLILIPVIFAYVYRTKVIEAIFGSRFKYILVSLLLTAYLYSTLLLYLFIQTVYHNSQISLDINEQLAFDMLSITTYLSLLTIALIAFLIGHIIIKIHNEHFTSKESTYVGGSVLFICLLVALLDNINFLVPILITLLFIIIISFTHLYSSIKKIKFATYIYVLAWGVAASTIISYAILKMEEEQEFDNQIKFAEKFLVENDALAEFLLYDLNKKVKEDIFIQSRLSSPYLGKDVIKDKIRQVYLTDYFDKYDINIFLFDAQGRPFNPEDFMLRPVDIQISNKKYETSYKNIYYIDEPGDELAGRYLDLVEIKKRGLRVGYILLDLRLKKLIPENVYPELLVDHRFLQSFENKNYSYAVFRDGKIIYSSGRFNYSYNFPPEIIEDEEVFIEGTERGGYQHIALEDAEENIYVISVPSHEMEHFFSNFSFFFLLVVFVVIVISVVYAISFLLRGYELYYSARIQLYLSLAFFIPMVVVTLITLRLVSDTFKEEVIRENIKKAENIASNIGEDLVSEPYANQLINILLRASRYANADANIFTPKGHLMATSQPLIYENDLLAPYINPQAVININYLGEQIFTADESVGDLDFKTTYHSIRSPDTGNLVGILSVPFFQSEVAFEKHEIDIFTSVINVFTVIFLLFLLISYLASEYLTFPLKIITKKLQNTSLEFNEPLSWEAKDEIGLMVKEYNRMVQNLEESKQALAKTEKESAWREMAQQVAHEIKNPLTPMKLTLQHMQRTADTKEGNIKKSVNTLLQQVNILSEIAGSFSAFASMPSPTKEKFDLHELTNDTISLYSNTEGVKINVNIVDRPLMVEADKKLLGRIISNIIINAIEAGQGYQPLIIDIKLKTEPSNKVLLSISDNGPGIEENVREKIFMPHFSTKRRGSGIGLAIARRGVEHAGGRIWFETEEGEGTTFFILLPLAND